MEPLFYVIAIMGCGDASALCEEARVEPARYTDAAQCRAAMPDVLLRHTDLAYPTISAACQSNGERMARADKVRTAG